MRISVTVRKGGVGKSNISFNLRKDLGLKYITNDKENSPIYAKFPELYLPLNDLETSFEEYVNTLCGDDMNKKRKYLLNKDKVEKQRGLNIVKKTEGMDTILDLGGFYDKKSQEYIVKSDLVIIPTRTDISSMTSRLRFFKRLEQVNKNYLFIVTMGKTQREYERRKRDLIKNGVDENKILPFSDSRRVPKSILEGKTIVDFYNGKNKLSKHIYKKIYNEYQEILKFVVNRYKELQN